LPDLKKPERSGAARAAWQNAPMSGLERIAAIVVAVLVVVGVAVVGLTVADGDATAGDGPSASAQPSATVSPSIEPEPSGAGPFPDDEETLAILREIEEQVIAIRGLTAADIGEPDLITRAELAGELQQIFEEEYPPEEQAEDNFALRALGLLEPGQDVAELQLQLLGDQVLGFYDEVDKRMVVVTDAGLDANAKVTYAHEYTHALQDASFDLDSLARDADGQDDRGLARTALIEGDAMITMLAWAFAHLTPAELAEIGTTPQPDTSGIPSWMVEQLVIFPYADGLNWAGAVAGRDPLAPEFGEIDAAYAEPPDSTEQIIDVEKWMAREAPIGVEVADLANAFGDGWTEVDNTPVGQAVLRMMLEFFGVPRDEALAATSGWGGDRVVIASGPDDAFAVAWRLAWDTPGDATEFLQAYRAILDSLPFPAVAVEVSGGEILVAHAANEEILRRTVDVAND
jgi:hypothetical protein